MYIIRREESSGLEDRFVRSTQPMLCDARFYLKIDTGSCLQVDVGVCDPLVVRHPRGDDGGQLLSQSFQESFRSFGGSASRLYAASWEVLWGLCRATWCGYLQGYWTLHAGMIMYSLVALAALISIEKKPCYCAHMNALPPPLHIVLQPHHEQQLAACAVNVACAGDLLGAHLSGIEWGSLLRPRRAVSQHIRCEFNDDSGRSLLSPDRGSQLSTKYEQNAFLSKGTFEVASAREKPRA